MLRIRYGFYIIVGGFVLVAFVFVFSIAKWTEAKDVIALVGSATSVVGTVVGAFLGVQVGSAGKEKSEAARKLAEERALRMAAELPPNTAKAVMDSVDKLMKLIP